LSQPDTVEVSHRTVEVGRDFWTPSGLTPLLKQGCLEPVAQDHVQRRHFPSEHTKLLPENILFSLRREQRVLSLQPLNLSDVIIAVSTILPNFFHNIDCKMIFSNF